jgi:poly(A) polymerase/tRNA nucleotidyltransferase (CCA-adding enzyme)
LPVVSPSNIYEDLRRRDFSVNAIALSISKDNAGEILDPYDGIGDIRRRLIRILHRKSFIDDPTRIFRALRYKNRLNFQLERSTEALLKEAISKGMVKRISKQRLMNELKLIFAEKTYLKSLDDLLKYRIFFCNRRRLKNIDRMGSLRYYYFLNVIGAENFPLNRQELKIIKDLRNISTLKNILSRVKTNSTLFYTLNGVDRQVLMVIPRLYPGLKPAILRYQSLRKTKPLINGEDLKRLQIKPGPRFKELLTKIYSLQLDGKIHNKRAALSFLKNG